MNNSAKAFLYWSKIPRLSLQYHIVIQGAQCKISDLPSLWSLRPDHHEHTQILIPQRPYWNNNLVFHWRNQYICIYMKISYISFHTDNTFRSELFILQRQKFPSNSSGSLDDVFNVDFISKFFLSVLQKYSLSESRTGCFWSTLNYKFQVICCTMPFLPAVHDRWQRRLQAQSLHQECCPWSHFWRPSGRSATLQLAGSRGDPSSAHGAHRNASAEHTDQQAFDWTHLKASPLRWEGCPKKTDLLIQEDLPLEIRSEVLDFGTNVLLHHSVQRDPKLIQLGLQRGQLCSLLQINQCSASDCLLNLKHHNRVEEIIDLMPLLLQNTYLMRMRWEWSLYNFF